MTNVARTSTAASESVPPEELLGFEEALRFLGTSKTTLYRLLEQGDLKGTRVGRQWRFRRTDLQAYLERGPVAAAAAPTQAVETELEFFAEELRRMDVPVPEEREDITDSAERRTALLAARILVFALSTGASDIHLEPEKNALRLRLRLGGVMSVLREMPVTLGDPLTIYIKQLAEMNLAERRLPQDGRIALRHDGKDFDLRVSCLPCLGGESIVIRILDKSSVLIGLEKLGIRADDLKKLEEWLRRPSGMVVTTGPTGAGKSTLLYSCMQHINRPEIKMLSVEDPIEYQMPGVTQVAVNKRAGLNFSNAVRSFLRQDPDVIMIGQMRDLDTAEIAIETAITGHLVLTALHTEDAASALLRLREMGVEPFLVKATVRGVIAQRLVRRVCPDCSAPDEVGPASVGFAELRRRSAAGGYILPEDVTFVAGHGCTHCRHTGYRGRIGLFEMLTATDEVMEAFKRGATPNEITWIAVQTQGMRTFLADGLEKAVNGITTVDEVLRVSGVIL
jgi:excisionase family DNA binding protein